jgi:predicted amidophosphoribosyltransferase
MVIYNELKEGMCVSCAKEKITKAGLLCDKCFKPYEHIEGDNEQKNPEHFVA